MPGKKVSKRAKQKQRNLATTRLELHVRTRRNPPIIHRRLLNTTDWKLLRGV